MHITSWNWSVSLHVDMETISKFPVTKEGRESNGPINQSFDVHSMLAWTNRWTNNRIAGDLRRFAPHITSLQWISCTLLWPHSRPRYYLNQCFLIVEFRQIHFFMIIRHVNPPKVKCETYRGPILAPLSSWHPNFCTRYGTMFCNVGCTDDEVVVWAIRIARVLGKCEFFSCKTPIQVQTYTRIWTPYHGDEVPDQAFKWNVTDWYWSCVISERNQESFILLHKKTPMELLVCPPFVK